MNADASARPIAGQAARSPRSGGGAGLAALASGTADPARAIARVAAARPCGRPGADDDAGPGRHRLCRKRPGVPAIYGLYATVVPLLAYALFGPSRILVLGPGFFVGRADPGRGAAAGGGRCRATRWPWPAMLAVVSGLTCIWPACCGLGFITELLSKPIRYGYMNGIALTVLISQLPKLFGVPVESDGPLRNIWRVGTRSAGRPDQLDRLRHRRQRAGDHHGAQALPAHSGHAAGRRRRHDRGWRVRLERHGRRASAGGRARRACHRSRSRGSASPSSAPSSLAACRLRWCPSPTPASCRAPMRPRPGPSVDPNQEMVGLGAANLAAGLFQGFPVSSSSSRTPVAEASGARTQLTGVVGAVAVAVLLLFAPHLLQEPPQCRARRDRDLVGDRLFEISDLVRIFRMQRWEFWLSIVCLVGGRHAGRDSRHRARDRGRGHRVPLGRLAAILHGAGPGGGDPRLPRHHAPSGGAAHSRPGAVPLGCAAVLRQRRAVPHAPYGGDRQPRRHRCGACSSPPSRSPAST